MTALADPPVALPAPEKRRSPAAGAPHARDGPTMAESSPTRCWPWPY